MAALLDMSRIPLPDAVEELDFSTLLSVIKSDYVARMRVDDPGYSLNDNDPAARLLETLTFREMLWRARVNDSVRGTLLASAVGQQLDDLGADPAYGPTKRLTITPEDPGPPLVPAVMESDNDYRQRLAQAPHALSVAGPTGAYEAIARAAHGSVVDVAVTRTAPGSILVEVLMMESGAEGLAILNTVYEALSADTVRPVGDLVTVSAATHVASTVALTVYVDDGPDLAVVQAASQLRVNNLVLPKAARVRSGELLSQGLQYSFLGAAAVEGVTSYAVSAVTGMTPADTAWWPMTITVTTQRQSASEGLPDPGPIAPVEMANIGGAAFTLNKNWDFGTSGNIGNTVQLEAEFDPYTLFGTWNNGGQYGTDTVAPSYASALSGQAVDPGGRFRSFTANSMLAYVRAWTDGNDLGPGYNYNGGNGSIYSKFKYASGGAVLGKTIVWETRMRIQNPTVGQWFALWTVGNIWDDGPEMDVIESFSAWDGLPPTAWHSNSVGGTDTIDYYSTTWWAGQEDAGWPDDDAHDLAHWHTFTYVLRPNDHYEVWFDGIKVQYGVLVWKVPSTMTSVNMQFAFDFGALHTVVGDYIELVIPAADLPIIYEIDYSRLFDRNS